MNKKGILIILSGFSGVGKGTVVRRLLSDYDNYALSISATTRKPREGEEDGVSYFFKSKEEFEQMIKEEICRMKEHTVGASKENQDFLIRHNSSTLKTGSNLAELVCRPELSYEILSEIDPDRPSLPADVIEQVEIEIKYEGYIERQLRQVEQFKKMERKKIPADIDYDSVPSLRIEARQKLKSFHPMSIGQASRISGVSPADVSVLLVYLEQYNRKDKVE